MTSATTKTPMPLAPAHTFSRACRYEWRHLTALRSTWILLGVVTLLSLLTGLTILLDLDGQDAASPAIVADWLPFAAGRAMLTDASAYSGDDRPFVRSLVGSHLSPSEATVVFCLYRAAIAAAGMWAYCRRDPKAG